MNQGGGGGGSTSVIRQKTQNSIKKVRAQLSILHGEDIHEPVFTCQIAKGDLLKFVNC